MKTIRIYSDESRHKNERFLLLGGIWVEEENMPVIENSIKALRNKYGYINTKGEHIDFLGEFKWTKVSYKYLAVYKELADLFFEWIDKDIIRSCVMLVDTQNPLVVSQSNIKKEGYFKLLYQLYFHNSRIPATYKIFPDRITNPTQHNVNFETLDKCLEVAFQKKFTPLLNPSEHPGLRGFINNVTPVDSKKSSCIQLIDVIMGALGYLQNGLFRKEDAKKAKVELMKYIFEKITLSGAIKVSGKSYYVAKSTKFNIWLFRPNNKKTPQ
ncbi:MAG: DUF3800 domain-containing protein [Candidatus Magasanikbacteria bacterium]|nr:DUF3800 domain-containing protein [Candidatus Magasanikbacteria bacterium]